MSVRNQKPEVRRQKKKVAVVLVGHGSREKGFQSAMEKVARRLKAQKKYDFVRCAYLEITPPSIPEAAAWCARKGARKIFVLPYFLLKGRHTQSDIPQIVKRLKAEYLGLVHIVLCPYLGYHDRLVSVVTERLRQST